MPEHIANKSGAVINPATEESAGAASASIGATTATPFDGDEDGTARVGISLWKGVKNYVRAVKLGIGATTDAIVAVAANGSVIALLKRVTQGLEDLKTGITLGGTVTADQGAAGAAAWPVEDSTLATAVGAQADAAQTDPGIAASLIAYVKGLLTRLGGGLPAALAAGGGLKVEGVAGGVAQPISGTITANQGTAGAAAWPVVPEATEVHLGEMGGNSPTITINPTVDTAIYAAQDVVGGKLVITNAVRVAGGTARLESIMLLDRSNQKPALTLLIFNADPTAATLTDQAPIVLSTDDQKVCAKVNVSVGDWETVSTAGNVEALANVLVGRQVKSAATRNLWLAIVCSAGSTPDFVAATDLQLLLSFLAD